MDGLVHRCYSLGGFGSRGTGRQAQGNSAMWTFPRLGVRPCHVQPRQFIYRERTVGPVDLRGESGG